MENCPCGRSLPYDQCCAPLLGGSKHAETAEDLMRSRYTAYAKAELEYLFQTTAPSKRKFHDKVVTKEWAENSEWKKLEILRTEKGGVEDQTGIVEFIAYFKEGKNEKTHHEIAEFIKEEGTWFFQEGKMAKSQPFQRTEKKIGRNDPCPCGSGKKYKKCCGK